MFVAWHERDMLQIELIKDTWCWTIILRKMRRKMLNVYSYDKIINKKFSYQHSYNIDQVAYGK